MFRGNGAGAAAGGGGGGGGSGGGAPPAASSAGGAGAAPSSASTTMLNFARSLGLGKGGSGGGAGGGGGAVAASPPPLDLPNPSTPPGAGDTSSVFYVDDTLSELARVKRYSLSQLPLQRLVYVKRIGACARSVGLSESIAQLLPLFPKLAADQEAVVRTAAANELANVAHMLADPNVPYNPNPSSSLLNSTSTTTSSKPPSTAQSPDPTLEDDQLVEVEANDVSNVLPASLPPASAAASQTGAAPTAADGVVPPAEAAAIVAAAATVNPDAMDVDDSVAVSPATDDETATDSAPDAKESSQTDGDADSTDDADSSVPMDVSETADDSDEQSEEQTAAEAAAIPVPSAAPGQQQQSEGSQAEEASGAVKPASPVSAPAPSPSSPSSSSSLPSSLTAATATTSSPTSSSSSATTAPAAATTTTAAGAAPIAHSPLSDPTSSLRLESYEHIKDTVIPCLNTLILDGNAEVRAAACDALVRVADVLRGDDVGKVVLTLVLNLAHDERDEQRTTAVHLMHELAPRLGHDLCRSFVALELAAFADDSTFRVRKATAQSFGHVCAVVGEAFTCSKLLPSYVRLSKDLIWGVRASCAKSLVAVTKVVGPATRAEVIIPMFERFAKDSSRWVRNGAYEILGPFLYALGPDLVSRELLALFAGIPSMSSAVVDQEVNYHAAFNLPAVLQTVGAERWAELAPCFAALAKDTKFPVRRTLSYSLHELAALLGPALTEQSLLPALDAFLRDLDEVRYGVLKNFALLLRAMTPPKRLAYLEVLWLVAKQNENWRWRLLWAKQLGAFANLFDADRTLTDIRPLAFALCKDQVAAVRRTAALALGRLLVRFLSFATPNSVVAPLLADMHAFASSSTFMERQLYLRMVEGCVGQVSAEMLEQFLQRALTLASDKTSNVRLACAHTLRSIIGHPHVQQSASVRAMLQRLSSDSQSEVRRTTLEALAQHANSVLAADLASLAISGGDSAAATAAAAASAANAAVAASSTEHDLKLSDSDLDDILAGPASSADAAAASSSSSSAAASSSAPPSPAAATAASSAPASPSSPAAADSLTAASVSGVDSANAATDQADSQKQSQKSSPSKANGDSAADEGDDTDGDAVSPDQVGLIASE